MQYCLLSVIILSKQTATVFILCVSYTYVGPAVFHLIFVVYFLQLDLFFSVSDPGLSRSVCGFVGVLHCRNEVTAENNRLEMSFWPLMQM